MKYTKTPLRQYATYCHSVLRKMTDLDKVVIEKPLSKNGHLCWRKTDEENTFLDWILENTGTKTFLVDNSGLICLAELTKSQFSDFILLVIGNCSSEDFFYEGVPYFLEPILVRKNGYEDRRLMVLYND